MFFTNTHENTKNSKTFASLRIWQAKSWLFPTQVYPAAIHPTLKVRASPACGIFSHPPTQQHQPPISLRAAAMVGCSLQTSNSTTDTTGVTKTATKINNALKSGTARGSNYKTSEDVVLAHAWIRVPEDPVSRSERKGSTFYEGFWAAFNSSSHYLPGYTHCSQSLPARR